MPVTRTDALHQIDEALRQRGFAGTNTEVGRVWRGTTRVGNRTVRLGIRVPDLLFAKPPVVAVLNNEDLPRAHVLSGGTVCYALGSQIVLDIQDPAGSVLRCLELAIATLEKGDTAAGRADIRAEFANYWNGQSVLVDLPDDRTQADLFAIPTRAGRTLHVIAASADFAAHFGRLVGTNPERGARIAMVSIDQSLDVSEGTFPPRTLMDVRHWLRGIAPKAVDRFLNALLAGSTPSPVFVRAPNGTIGIRISLPGPIEQMRGKGFRPETWKREVLNRSDEVPIERFTGFRIDEAYRVTRNLGGRTGLSGKRLALIGAGAIGSYLGGLLVRVGAGSGPPGRLDIFDTDILAPGNLGRHLLGVEDLVQPKAEALANHLLRSAPGLSIAGFRTDVLDALERMRRYDLVIDATGEEAVALALNTVAIETRRQQEPFPPVHHIWLIGNGAAAQSFFNGFEGKACLRCLRPKLGDRGRYSPMTDDGADSVVTPADGCGGAYAPFAASAPTIAAGLALEALLDWASGDPRPTLRTIRIDQRRTQVRKDVSPEPHQACPVCAGAGTIFG